MKFRIVILLVLMPLVFSCKDKDIEIANTKKNKVFQARLMVLDPGHFHAALVFKNAYKTVSPYTDVFAPEGPELQDFMNKLSSYNKRNESPTAWKIREHVSANFLDSMLYKKPGNIMVVAGKNSKKSSYINKAVNAGIHVFADKPMIINPKGFELLKQTLDLAKEKDVLVYDIMTERFEITTIMQKLLSQVPFLFGELIDGSIEEPAISKESVHHFSKVVSGQPLVRPPWFFNIREEGDGLVDVTTHLVDLVQWEAFPNQIIDTSDIEMIRAKKTPTILTKEEFRQVTGLDNYTKDLLQDVVDNQLYVACNGEMVYKIKGKFAKVSVKWNFRAPNGTGDTHYSVMRGTLSDLIIRQGEEEGYKPALYIRSKVNGVGTKELRKAVLEFVEPIYPGTVFEEISDGYWKLVIPKKFQIGHEAHFGQVASNYLTYLMEGKLPIWETPNMLTKYYTIIEAYKMASN